ncbi:MAG: LutC/YkgG family protein [bacterium JZ-2024 1]
MAETSRQDLLKEFIQKAEENGSEVFPTPFPPPSSFWQSIPDLPDSAWCWENQPDIAQALPSFAFASPAPVETAQVGFTIALLGIAQTGTLAVSGEARLLSLLPPVHIALLRKENLVWTLSEGLYRLRREADLYSMVLITGPSRTADIEQTLVKGVHGPQRCIILLVE